MIVYVTVGCALTYPPRLHHYRRIAVWVPTPKGVDDFGTLELEATDIAFEIASSHDCSMVVEMEIDRIE